MEDEFKYLNQDLLAESDIHLATADSVATVEVAAVAKQPDDEEEDHNDSAVVLTYAAGIEEVPSTGNLKQDVDEPDEGVILGDDDDDENDGLEHDADEDDMNYDDDDDNENGEEVGIDSTNNDSSKVAASSGKRKHDKDEREKKIRGSGTARNRTLDANAIPVGGYVNSEGILITTNVLYKEALKYNRKKDEVHPVVHLLDLMNKNEAIEAGWLRINEAIALDRAIPDLRTFLSDDERELVLKLVLPLKLAGIPVADRIAWAWGITKRSIERMIKRARSSDDLTVKRKKRSDYGTTLMNSERKRASVITDYHIFKKYVQKQHQEMNQQQQPMLATIFDDVFDGDGNSIAAGNTTDRKHQHGAIPAKQIKEMWENLPEYEKQQYRIIAEQHRARNETLLHEIEKVIVEGSSNTTGTAASISLSARRLVRDFSSDSHVPITNRTTLLKHIKQLKAQTAVTSSGKTISTTTTSSSSAKKASKKTIYTTSAAPRKKPTTSETVCETNISQTSPQEMV